MMSEDETVIAGVTSVPAAPTVPEEVTAPGGDEEPESPDRLMYTYEKTETGWRLVQAQLCVPRR